MTNPIEPIDLSTPEAVLGAAGPEATPPAPPDPAIAPPPVPPLAPPHYRWAPAPSMPYTNPYDPYRPMPKKVYPAGRAEGVLALVVIVLGYLAWNWLTPRFADQGSFAMAFPSVGVTAFFVLAMACSLLYFRAKQVPLSRGGAIGAVLLLLAVLPYAIFATTPIHILFGPALVIAYLTWHAYVARTAVAPRLGALTLVDTVQQVFAVPFSHFGSWAAGLRTLFKERKQPTQLLVALIAIVVALPVIALVFALLVSADAAFSQWISGLTGVFERFDLWRLLWQLGLGVPLGIYLFALMYGNAHPAQAAAVTAENSARSLSSARKLSTVALGAPTIVLIIIYLAFLAVTGTNLVSALLGNLPAEVTYAAYAREGFFQLTVVAMINLAVLAFTYLFSKRGSSTEGGAPTYSKLLRWLGAILASLTLLLVAMAASKMIIYISSYNLTSLRLTTMWAMAVMFIVFLLVLVWNIRPFKVGTPIAIVLIVATLGLVWANPDRIIADYNVDRYLAGNTRTVDVAYLGGELGDGAIPALIKLRDQASDPAIRQAAKQALQNYAADGSSFNPRGDTPWTSWSWQAWYWSELVGRG
ncbi:MAG: DUF4173 domain-containing protein [Propionibacteriaceae bacterium]|jgi:hypothetical protein|nr:DUF4173 domain-containing protein [Propionibacteriaceae bacterium]